MNQILKNKQYKRWIALGIVGSLLIGYGDWLLGYVDPIILDDSFYLRSGHGVTYELWKPIVSMIVATVGMLFYIPLFYGLSQTIQTKRTKIVFLVTSIFGLTGWLLVHYYVSSLVYQYAWGVQHNIPEAFEYTTAVLEAFFPFLLTCFATGGIPAIVHLIATLKGKTCLQKWTAFVNPIFGLSIIAIIIYIAPQSKFIDGIRMMMIHESMFIWSVAILISRKKTHNHVFES